METGRGKKSKKAGWHLTLGVKDAIFAGIGIVGLMMISFTLGTLAGRGDIYRAAYSWGLLAPERPPVQALPQVALVPAAPLPAPASPAAATPAPATPAPAAAPAAAPAPSAPHAVAAAPHHPQPVAGSIAKLPVPPAAAKSKKKAKAAARAQEQRAREEQLRRERLAMAEKLTFLNSFDSTPKSGKGKDKTKATATKSQPIQIKVGTFRDSKTAKARMAEWQKKGVKVSLKQGKDAKGVYYVLYRQAPAYPKENEKMAQKEKPGSHKPRHD